MNNIAYQDNKGNRDTSVAKNGIAMKVKKKYFTYENLPSARSKKRIMADYGMYMDPGPRYGQMQYDIPSVPSYPQGPVPLGTPPDTSKIPLPDINKTGTAATSNGKKKKDPTSYKGQVGDALVYGLSAVDALIPGQRATRQTVVTPQMGYNPYPYGTGSQMMEYGGDIFGHDIMRGQMPMTMESYKKGGWIQKAVNPKHKGYCTPMTKKTCTPRRKALARTFKKYHGFHEDGGIVYPWMLDEYEGGGIIPDNMSPFSPHMYAHGGTARGGSDTTDLMEQWIPWMTGEYANGGDLRSGAIKNRPMKKGGKVTSRGGSDTTDLVEQWIPWMTGEYEKGGRVSASKAKEILRDGTAHGKKLTAKQKRYFGWIAGGGRAALGLEVSGDPDPTKPKPGEVPQEASYNPNVRSSRTGSIEQDALIADRIGELVGKGYDPYTKEGRAILAGISTGPYGPQFASDFGVRLKSLQSDPSFGKMTPEQRIMALYQTGATGTTSFDQFLRRSRSLGGNPSAYWQGNPTNPTRMKQGGIMYADGGEIGTMWGGNAELESYNPYDGGTVAFNGASHDDGGIGMYYNDNPVEVEGGEYASMDNGGDLHIYGNMYVPGTNTKFKSAAKALSNQEKKYNYLKNRGSDLVNNSNPANKYEQLTFNSGRAMMAGGDIGQQDIANKKAKLSALQKAMLDVSDEYGIDAQSFSKGKMKKARGGASIPFFQEGGDPGNDPTRADRNRNPGNIKYGEFAKKYGARKDADGFAIFPNINSGLQAMKDLLKSKSYKNLSVKDAIHKWTGGNPYRYDLGELTGKKVSDLTGDEFNTVIGTMRKGEGTKYGVTPTTPRTTQVTPTPKVPVPDTFTPYTIPEMNLTDVTRERNTTTAVPPPLDTIQIPDRKDLPSNVEPLHANQIMGEIYAAATNRVEPVPAQRYEPELFTPYQVSFQDRLNQNQATYNQMARQVGYSNPSALGTLSAQKYAADSAVKAEEFRANQAIANEITNKNIAMINDAQMKNLGLADQQMVRQSQARSKTRELNQMIVNSLSSKYAQNELENKRLAAYENLYDYRFMPTESGGLRATYFGPNAMFNFDPRSAAQRQQDLKTVNRYDQYGNLKGYTQYDESSLYEQEKLLDLERKSRSLPLMSVPPLNR